ncbi:MAG TPA: metal ABC transporter permease [Campylobacterales bacterium]|nr:metal ABC transporter permease [Campylobacterales bacterium]
MEIFEYSFMIRAFLAGSIIAVLASSLGLFVVVRRYSMLSDSLAHISLLGVALGFLFSVSTTWSAIAISVFASWVIEYLRRNHNIYSDSVLSIFLSGSLAMAIIVVSLSDSFNSSLFDYLFGSIVAVSDEDIWVILGFGTVSILFIANYYKKLIFIAFDEEVAETSGIHTGRLNYALVSLVAITIGLSIKIVGALLIGALMIIPVISAMQFYKSFFITGVLAVALSLFSVVVGLVFSFYASLPSGATIVVAALLLFAISLALKVLSAKGAD